MDKKLKYYDLMEDLRKQIVSGKIKPGEKLPSENELSGTYQVSRLYGKLCRFFRTRDIFMRNMDVERFVRRWRDARVKQKI
jgi:hypothetical protein